MTDDLDPTPYDLRPSGVVTVNLPALGDEPRTVRRPTLGEFRRFREAHHAASRQITDTANDLRARLEDVNERLLYHRARLMAAPAREQRLHVLAALGDDADPARVAERERLQAAADAGTVTDDDRAANTAAEREAQEVLSAIDDAALDAYAKWTADTLTALGVPVTVDDLDPALASVDFTVALLDHWRNVTPLRGR